MDINRKEKFIKGIISQLLEIIGVEAQITTKAKSGVFSIDIHTKEAGFLIGPNGTHLDALQHLVRLIVNKKSKRILPFVLDVNNYRQERQLFLEELARNIAEKSLSEKIVVTLQPMPPYERRIIHLALNNYPNINTQSIGEGAERRVVVSPVGINNK